MRPTIEQLAAISGMTVEQIEEAIARTAQAVDAFDKGRRGAKMGHAILDEIDWFTEEPKPNRAGRRGQRPGSAKHRPCPRHGSTAATGGVCRACQR